MPVLNLVFKFRMINCGRNVSVCSGYSIHGTAIEFRKTRLPESFSLPIHCPKCAGALTAEVGEITDHSEPVPWQCPYCRAWTDMDFAGPLLWIAKRVESGAKH